MNTVFSIREGLCGVNRMFCSVYKYCCASIMFPSGKLSLLYCSDVLLLLYAKKETPSYIISSTSLLTMKAAAVKVKIRLMRLRVLVVVCLW